MVTNQGVAKHESPPPFMVSADPAAIRGHLEYLRQIVDRRLRLLVPHGPQVPQQLQQAMSYSLLSPGKRLRPILALLSSYHFGIDDLSALDPACALEMVHSASLIMDDLPAMDNSALRRGQPTTHLKFGDEIAILTGVALLNNAYAVIGNTQHLSEGVRLTLVRSFAQAIGTQGLVGGQVIDLKERDEDMKVDRLETLNECKTAALFVAAVETGAIVANVRGASLDAARVFASKMGLAFQIADDLLDDHSYAGLTGKDTGKDQGKPTIVSMLGHDRAKLALEDHLAQARLALGDMGAKQSPLTAFFEASFSQLLDAQQR